MQGLGEEHPTLFYEEPLLLFLVLFVQDVSGALKLDGSDRGICDVDLHSLVLPGLLLPAATLHAAGMSLADTYDSASEDDDDLVLEDNYVEAVRPVMPHFSGIAICHDDDDDDGPFLETNVAVASPAKLFLPHQVLLVLVLTLLLESSTFIEA